MPVPALPEELLHIILQECLSLTLDEFFRFPPDKRPGSKLVLQRNAQLLRVCKKWRRIGMPLLYPCLRICRTSYPPAHVSYFTANPAIARLVESLRLDEFFGRGMVPLAELLPNVQNLYLDVTDRAFIIRDDNAELEEALPLLNPTTVYIRDLCPSTMGYTYHHARHTLRWCIVMCMSEMWSRVTYVCLGPGLDMKDDLAIALGNMPALAKLSVAAFDAHRWLNEGGSSYLHVGRVVPFMEHVFASESLQVLICRGQELEPAIRAAADDLRDRRPTQPTLEFV